MDLHVLEENSAPLKKGAEVQRERVQHAGFISKKRPVQCASCPLPRTILAVTVGSALAVADALMQGHTRNPLADPGLLGISAGAALAVVIGFTWCGFTSVTATGVMALIGALIAATIVFAAANVVGARSDPLTLVLAGAALSAVFASITTAIIYTSTTNLDHMRMWTVGSVAGRDGSFVFSIAIALVVFTLLALFTAPHLNSLALGEDIARSLGTNILLARMLGLLFIALLAGLSTAAAGPIGFVAFAAPHVARIVAGGEVPPLVSSALTGAVLLLSADFAVRTLTPTEVPVGLVTSACGGVLLLILLARRRQAALI
ncbi:putative membrane protein [Corynebacterium resistens DSM 45100]|uniref:Membrane protein n=1 Tax=Corynebacterium resistens (strain DSM 45100 / JCM 12819 / GTC 2026 / SICGH 158) TaxID=662755 RepID=F8E295_CORRG|nr:putative membrane protein [Corynebacterium resistens DSM 45100]